MNHFIKLASYNLWANTLLCHDFLLKTDALLADKEINSSFSSLRKTMYHIWDAEVIWYNRLCGGAVTVLPIQHEPMSLELFSEKMIGGSKKLLDLIHSYSENHFNTPVLYRNTQGKEFQTLTSDIIIHVMNHSTYHRGQAVTILRQLGFGAVSSTDFITWTRHPI